MTRRGSLAALTGAVAVKSGTLTLAPTGSLRNSSGVSIGRGAIFDASQVPSPYVWPATSSVSGSGSAASPALINTAGALILTNSPGYPDV